MPLQVCTTAKMKCAMAVPPGMSVFNATPKMIQTSMQQAGNIMDNKPMVNVPSFGMCMSPTNPQFIAATAAALGTPTPVPCVPVLPAPWVPGVPNVLVSNQPAIDNTCMLTCALGVPMCITFIDAGQTTHLIP